MAAPLPDTKKTILVVEDEPDAAELVEYNLKAAGFLHEERAYLDRWFDAGWVDLGRRLGGDGPGPYTWWSWRGKAFDNDSGWRIDYQIATEALAERAQKAEVDRASSYDRRFSDHAPLVVTYDL